MPKTPFEWVRSIALWAFALGGVGIFLWYVVEAGAASVEFNDAIEAAKAADKPTDGIELKEIRPAELKGFGIAAGALLATTLGSFLGVIIRPGGGQSGLRALNKQQHSPWARLIGAVAYVIILVVAVYFWYRADWNPDAAEVIVTSAATVFGVVLGAMTAVFGAAEPPRG